MYGNCLKILFIFGLLAYFSSSLKLPFPSGLQTLSPPTVLLPLGRMFTAKHWHQWHVVLTLCACHKQIQRTLWILIVGFMRILFPKRILSGFRKLEDKAFKRRIAQFNHLQLELQRAHWVCCFNIMVCRLNIFPARYKDRTYFTSPICNYLSTNSSSETHWACPVTECSFIILCWQEL